MTRLALAKALLGLTATLMMVANLLGCSGDAGVTIPPLPDDAGPPLDARPDAPPDATPSQTAAATPEFHPAPGTFDAPQSITLRTDTAGASIHYTLDGSPPDSKSPVYTSPISLAKTATLKAIARKTGFDDSAVRSGTYVIDIPPGVVEPAQLEPNSGDYPNDVEVHLTSATADATFCYTLDGAQPGCTEEARCASSSEAAAGTVLVSKSGQKLRAIACKKGMLASSVTQADYTLSAAAPVFDPMPGSYDPHNPRSIALASDTRGSVIHYSVNGSEPPSCSSPDTVPENGALPILTADAIIQAVTCKQNYATSAVVSATYLGAKCVGDFNILSVPGLQELARCEEITGNLTIGVSGLLTDLAPLAHLRSVNGNLTLQGNGALTSLHGLEALAVVGGEMIVASNAALTRIDELVALQSVGVRLMIWRNEALTELVGPNKLTKIGSLSIAGNPNLQHVGGFSQLAEIGGNFVVSTNAALISLDDMPALTKVVGNVGFSFNRALETQSGFTRMHEVGGNFTIDGNEALKGFSAFSQLTTIRGTLQVSNNPVLQSLPGFGGLTAAGGLTIRQNLAMTEIGGLDALESGSTEIEIASNPKLVRLNGLRRIPSATHIRLIDNAAMEKLEAFTALTQTSGDVSIVGCLGLKDLTGLEALGKIGGNLLLNADHSLTNLDALAQFVTLAGSLTITLNETLPTCQADRVYERLRAHGYGSTPDIRDNHGTGTCD
ncbi:chitobiase/beta-hexosaminidase C-terminal domain-containing protein [Pendulispora rubella]|uniref:Chitobiase/beta-hexosaminidase C-terminal domain-containing protein n=1 Tax=Pendulispora rubella TaxID=2741070 RepID=A0ABZ2LGZ6_9BACT